MEKRFRKHPVICEEGQISCMFGMISMLDFRKRPLNQGLISNEKLVNQKDILISSQRRSTVKALMEEEISAEKKESCSIFGHVGSINNTNKARKIRRGAQDYPVYQCGAQDYPVYQCSDAERTRHNSDQTFLNALEVLKMNKELCLKLLQDGNSHSSVRNTKSLQDLQAETGCGFNNSKITYDSLLKRIKNKHGDRSRTSEFHSTSSPVVVRNMPISEDVSCNCSIKSYKPVLISLKNDKKKIKHPLEQIHVEFKREDKLAEKGCQIKDSSQFDIFLEAKRHMSKRLSNLAALSSQEPPRTLERILSLPKLTSESSNTPAVATKPNVDQSQLFQETPRRKSTNGMEKRESEEWTSPVSVLEPFFIDNLSSPSTPGSQWGNYSSMQLQPLRLDFEEYSTILSSPDFGSCFNDSDTISKYVKSVLQSRPMNWDDIFLKLYQSGNACIFNEMELCPVNSYWKHKLLFDCTNEAFLDVCHSHLGSGSLAWLMTSNLVGWNKLDLFNDEINKRVNRQFVPRPLPRTLQDIVWEDLMNDTWKWMDLRVDIEDIANQVVEFIIGTDLIPDIITEFFHLDL